MYEWLEKELAEIKTRKFHLVHQPTFEGRAPTEIEWPCLPPPSFSQFIERFGSAFLYRELSYYVIRIFKKPRQEMAKGEQFLEFGGYDSGIAYFKKTLMNAGDETPVFEARGASGICRTSGSFHQWIEDRARAARRRYGKRRWKKILEGPPPFSAEELEIVRVRSKFKWTVVGVSKDRKLIFEVRNESDRVLPYLTIGIKGPGLLGGLWLPVSEIPPGKSARIERDAYADLADPHEVVAFPEPDPEPEDRDRYWEFGMPE